MAKKDIEAKLAEREENKPTPETVAKARPDVIQRMLDDGRIREEHHRAAMEILSIMEAWEKGQGCHAQKFERVDMSGSFTAPGESILGPYWIAYKRRYLPWRNEMGVTAVYADVKASRLRVCVDVIVSNMALRDVETAYRMRHGRAVEEVRKGLHRYCQIGGWV